MEIVIVSERKILLGSRELKNTIEMGVRFL
jgi:hypothetical protein